jgi:hypothetical protein
MEYTARKNGVMKALMMHTTAWYHFVAVVVKNNPLRRPILYLVGMIAEVQWIHYTAAQATSSYDHHSHAHERSKPETVPSTADHSHSIDAQHNTT